MNDSLDEDDGPNRQQNFPVILAASAGSQTHIAGTLHSRPESVFELDFFANPDADSSGFGEGRRYLGSTIVTTDPEGNVEFDAILPAASLATEWITATATNSDSGDTSEFSAAQCATDYLVTNADDSGPGSLRAAIEHFNSLDLEDLPDGQRPRIVFRIPTSAANFVDIDGLLGGDAEGDVFLIRPFSPLPAITAGQVEINGETQARFHRQHESLGTGDRLGRQPCQWPRFATGVGR